MGKIKKLLVDGSSQRGPIKYIVDFSIVVLSYWLSYLLRFEGSIPPQETYVILHTYPLFIGSFIFCNFFFKLTRSVWRYVSIRDLERIVVFAVLFNSLGLLLSFIFFRDIAVRMPRSIFVLNVIFVFLGLSGVRVLYRISVEKFGGFDSENSSVSKHNKHSVKKKNVLIIGDEDTAFSLQADIIKSYNAMLKIVGFITQNRERVGNRINAIPVIGTIADIEDIVRKEKVEYVFIAVDHADNRQMKEIIRKIQNLGVETRIVPTVIDWISKGVSLRELRELSFDDYLRRNPVRFDLGELRDFFSNTTIFVSGGAGSIGAEICRKLVRLNPRKVIIFDRSENNVFYLHRELMDFISERLKGNIEVVPLIGDIRDRLILEKVFAKHNIDYVIHTAALKHVPLSETNIWEAISINVCGTLNMMEVSIKYNVKKFMYISTDKAVEPISVMGATKRVGELLVKYFSQRSGVNTKFMVTRFGNVIGSSGNVIEVFTRQLGEGEKLTITHPAMERFFMSLEEASSLILKAISVGEGGEIFVLDMGEPVKIKDLAYEIALFYGKRLEEKDFVYIGPRRGEKLKEKLFFDYERKILTPHKKIIVAQDGKYDFYKFIDEIRDLCCNILDDISSKDKIFALVRKYQTGFREK